jgi:hypothetical protein
MIKTTMKTYKVTFTVVCDGHPRKWVTDAIWENLNVGEDVLDYEFEEVTVSELSTLPPDPAS